MKVYCVFKSSWDGPELHNIFKNELDAERYSRMLNEVNNTQDWYAEEWIVVEQLTGGQQEDGCANPPM